MKFYSSISPFYDYIFPYNPLHLSFIEKVISDTKNDINILDVGCSTGSLAIEMAKKAWHVSAIDFDKDMIQLAKAKKNKDLTYPKFKSMNMLKIEESFEKAYFNQIICFGNTLVHLNNLEEIESFLNQVYKLLTDNGYFSFQILNYSHILRTKVPSLPLIENQHIRFERYYHYNNTQSVNFKTKLTIKENQQEISNSIILYALELEDIIRLLKHIGFKEIHYYSNFKADPYLKDAFSLVVNAQKKHT